MVKSQRVNLVHQFYNSKSLPLNSQRIVNMYAEIEPDESRTKIALFQCAGLQEIVDFGIFQPVYAMEKMAGNLYAVVGSNVYEINNAMTATLVGTIPLAHGKVKLSSNGYQLVILTSSGRAWTYNLTTTTFAEIVDGDYQLASDVTFINGFTVFSVQGSDQFFWSTVRDSSAYDALDFQTAEDEPDNLVGLSKVGGELWLFGERTIEIQQITGGDLLFQKITGATKKIGCLTRDSISTMDNRVFWLGADRFIYMNQGYQAIKISNFAIDQLLEGYSIIDLNETTSFTYEYDGHKYYVITFPSKNKTFQFDIATGLWAERESLESSNNNIIRWRANCFSSFNGYRLVGDFETGIIYYMDRNYYKEGSNRLNIELVSSPQFNSFLRTSVTALYLDMETGVGATTGEGSDPQVIFEISNDGGRTYSNEITREFGELGKYKTVVKFVGIGISDNFTFRFRISDPVKKSIFGIYLDFEEGIS